MFVTRFAVAVLTLAGATGISACAERQTEPHSGQQSAGCAEQLKNARLAVAETPAHRDGNQTELNLYLWEAEQSLDKHDEQACLNSLSKIKAYVNF